MTKHNQECPDCGSSTALSIYEDGHTFCHKCNTRKGKHLKVNTEPEDTPETEAVSAHIRPLAKTFTGLPDRGIDAKAAERYGIKYVTTEIPNVVHVYPYFDQDGNHVGNKLRTKFKKSFFIEGHIDKAALFGQQAFPPGGKTLTIVEGECDAAAVYQMFDHKYPVVSVQGASTAKKNILENYEYVNSFKEIVLCLDNDKAKILPDGSTVHPGQDAAKEVAQILPLGKVRIVTLTQGKDANEYLQKGLVKEFQREWWQGPEYSPLGLKQAHEMWDVVKELPNYDSVPYPWEGLNDLTYGIRRSEFVTITAHPKVGKTSILREIVHSIKSPERKCGLMFLEEPNRDTLLGLMSISANKPLHLPDIREKVQEDELKAYFDQTYKDKSIVLWDHFGSNEIQKVLDYVRFLHAMGCNYIILDHLSIIVSDQSGDERKQLDEITTKLKQLTIELNIAVLAVIHQNRKGEIRGTAGVEQLSNIVIKLFRDRLHEDEEERNTLHVVVEYNRFCGRSGTACLLRYDPGTGRLTELPKDKLERFLERDKKKEEKEEW
jgi:twinkle protein